MNVAVIEKPVVATPVKRSRLKAVEPKSVEPSKAKILVFAKPGYGKTWVSMDFPHVYYFDCEQGASRDQYTEKLKNSGGVYFGAEQGSQNFETIIQEIKTLATEDHPYQTIVIDSISKIFNMEIAKEADRLGDKNAYGADKKPAVSYIRKLLYWLATVDMNVILIAHEKDLWGLDSKGDRSVIGQTFDAYDKLEYEFDLVLQIVRAGTKEANGIARVKKSRLIGFPGASTFEWSYPQFAAQYGKEAIERAKRTTVLATEEQLTEVRRLLEVVKLGDGTQDKWIAENQGNLAEVESDKIEKIIQHLKSKTQ